MKTNWKYAALGAIALVFAGSVFAVAADRLTSFERGPRLIDGSQLNLMVDAVNNIQGNGTANSGTFTTLSASGAITPTGGVAAAAGSSARPQSITSCNQPADTSTTGTDTTPSVTETYIAQLFIPANMTVTGVALLNGSAAAGNITVGLFTSAGAAIAAAKSASTAQSGTAAYQRIPFASAYSALGPATYYVGVQFNNTGARFRSLSFANCGASKKTGETYGAFTTITPPTTFTADVGPEVGLY